MKKVKLLSGLLILSFAAMMLSGCLEDEPKRFEDMTEKEYRQFLEWDKKQQQKKRDDSPAFK